MLTSALVPALDFVMAHRVVNSSVLVLEYISSDSLDRLRSLNLNNVDLLIVLHDIGLIDGE